MPPAKGKPPVQSAAAKRFQRPPWLTLPVVESTSNSMRAVIVNLVLLAIILLAAPLIAAQVARDQILLEPLNVPAALQATGLSPDVAADRLSDGLKQIIAEADSGKRSVNIIPEGEAPSFDLTGSGISVDTLISYARAFFNLHETVIGGEFRCGDASCSPAQVSLRLRVTGKSPQVIDLPPMRRSTEAQYWREAASKVMAVLDPFTALAAEADLHPSNAATIARRMIVSDHPDAKWAHNILGNIRRDNHEGDDALAEYQAALDLDADFPQALANMASTLGEAGRFDDANPFVDRLAKADPNSALEAETRGDLARAADKIDEALTWYKTANEREPLNARYLGKAALMLMNHDRGPEGLVLAQEAFGLSPDDPIPLGILAGYYAGQADMVALEKLYRDAAEFTPEDAALQAQHANLLMINKDYAGALDRIDQALLVDEGNAEYRVDRAEALNGLGRPQEALVELDLALKRAPDNADVVYTRATTLDLLGRKSESLDAYRAYLVLQPEGVFAEVAKAFLRFDEASSSDVSEPSADATAASP